MKRFWVCHLKIVSTDLNERREFPGWSSLGKRNATVTSSRKGIMKCGKTGVSLTILNKLPQVEKSSDIISSMLGKVKKL